MPHLLPAGGFGSSIGCQECIAAHPVWRNLGHIHVPQDWRLTCAAPNRGSGGSQAQQLLPAPTIICLLQLVNHTVQYSYTEAEGAHIAVEAQEQSETRWQELAMHALSFRLQPTCSRLPPESS